MKKLFLKYGNKDTLKNFSQAEVKEKGAKDDETVAKRWNQGHPEKIAAEHTAIEEEKRKQS
jgi:hypothetical protein